MVRAESLEMLSAEKHERLRLRASDAPTPPFVQVVPAEFPAAATCCPILLTKEPDTGSFYTGAMFGFKSGQNLAGSGEERGGFQPLMLQRQGFFLSGQHIAIDRGHARFSETEGDPLFDAARQPAEVLRSMQRVLGDVHTGLDQMKSFIGALLELQLIEPIDVSLQFDDGERMSLQGLYTVSLDRLQKLDDANALRLFRAGHLQLAYLMSASLRQISRLARIRNRKGRAA